MREQAFQYFIFADEPVASKPLADTEGDGSTLQDAGADPAAGGRSAGPMDNFLFPMILILGIFILFSMFGGRKQRKKRETMLESLKKHDRVQTIGGVIGSIVELKPSEVVLKVDESNNTRMTFARSSIQLVLGDGAQSAETQGELDR